MNTTTFAYRDSLEGARIRYADLLARALATPGLNGVSRVFAARTGRVWAGATGMAGAALMAVAAAAIGFKLVEIDRPLFSGLLTGILILSWPAMGIAYVLGRVLGAHTVKGTSPPRRTGDVYADLDRLERVRPVAWARRLAAQLEWKSTALPMMAVGLLAPLTIHLVFILVWQGFVWQGFDAWIIMSLAIVGHAHLTLAILYARFATKAAGLSSNRLAAERSRLEWSTFGTTVGVSALPGALFLLIPPLLTAVTALPFHPLLFRSMTRTIIAEREALA